MKRYLLFIGIAFPVCASLVWAEPVINEADQYYDIHGSTMKELFSEMHHKGGRTNGVAWCSWKIDWNPEYAQTSQGYIVKKANTKIDITYRYPRWLDKEKAPKELQKQWDDLVQNAIVHEKGHGAIAKEGVREVDQALTMVASHPDIRIFSGRVNAAGSKAVRTCEGKEQAYDKRTNFGRKQYAADQPDARPVSKNNRNNRARSQ